MLLSILLYLLCSLDQELQATCTSIVATLAAKQTEKYMLIMLYCVVSNMCMHRALDDKWIQPLLLMKNYSVSPSAQK